MKTFATGELSGGEMVTAFLGADIGEKSSIAMAEALGAQLKNAKVSAGIDVYMGVVRENNRQKREYEELKRRLQNGEISQAEFDQKAVEMGLSQGQDTTVGSDAIVTGKISKLGDRFTINVALIFEMTACARAQASFSDKSEWQSSINQMAMEMAEKVKDAFYCIDTDPHLVEVSGRSESFEMMFENLKGEPVSGEKALLRAEKMDHGSVNPEVVEIESGSAAAEYRVKKQLPNNILIQARSSKAACSAPASDQALPVEAVKLVLMFSGRWDMALEVHEEEGSVQAQMGHQVPHGEIPLYVDYEGGEVAGDGSYDRTEAGVQSFAAEDFVGGMKDVQRTERLTARVKGTVDDRGVGRLAVVLQGSASNLSATFWGVDSAGYSEQTASIPEEKDKTVLEPFEILLEPGQKTTLQKSFPGVVPGMSQSYRYEFEIKSEGQY